MPGLFGLSGREGIPAAASVFDRLMPPQPGCATEQVGDPAQRWLMGRRHLGVLHPETQAADAAAPVQAFVHGDLYHERHLEALAGTAAPPGVDAAAWLVAALYRRSGPAFARETAGAYCAAIVDADKRRVVLVADRLGSYPLYWTVSRGTLIFGSEVRAIVRALGPTPSLNAEAVADFLTFGFPFGVKTLASDIELVPPGSAVVFDWDTARISIERYATMLDFFEPWTGSRADYQAALQQAFGSAVDRALSGGHQFGVALSGGLDSRAILSATNGRAGSLATCTLGIKGCADEVIAARLARLAGTRHAFFELDNRYLSEFLPNMQAMVALTDGMYLSHGLTEMLAVGFLRDVGCTVLLRGHGGELAKSRLAWPLQTDERIDGARTTDELVAYLLQRVNYISGAVPWRELFTGSFHEQLNGAAERSLRNSLRSVPLSPADSCTYLYLSEHHRRFTVASLELLRQAVEVRLPFVDPEFLRILLGGAAAWRADTSIHRAVIGAGRPAFLRVRDSNTGARPDAGPVAGWVLDKANSLFKRLNLPGYRHYHQFQQWMTERLLASVEEVLLDERARARGVLQEPALRRLLEETRQGRSDHSYLLQVLLILELWQRGNE